MTRLLPARLTTLALAVTAIVAGCGRSSTETATTLPGASMPMASTASSAPGLHAATNARAANAGAAASSAAGNGGRELVNPDANTVVFLYYQLAHLPLPIDTWVESDSRVKFAPAPEKAAHRESVRAELNAASGSVQGVDALRLTMNANLSDYDPTYGEFTIRALSPSSVVNFNALDQKVDVSFRNGRTAQIWRVPADQAQSIRDKINYNGNVEIDVLLRIAEVLPGPGGGTITTDVVEYELRETQHGIVLGRVTTNAALAVN